MLIQVFVKKCHVQQFRIPVAAVQSGDRQSKQFFQAGQQARNIESAPTFSSLCSRSPTCPVYWQLVCSECHSRQQVVSNSEMLTVDSCIGPRVGV